MGKLVKLLVADKIQISVLSAIDNVIPRIELAVKSVTASSGWVAASITAKSEHRGHTGINTFFESVSERIFTNHEINADDETRRNIPDEVSELSVPRTHLDRQSHTHHNNIKCS